MNIVAELPNGDLAKMEVPDEWEEKKIVGLKSSIKMGLVSYKEMWKQFGASFYRDIWRIG